MRAASSKRTAIRAGRGRVLVEFPESLLRRAEDAACELDKNRSELIRTAVERFLEELEKNKLESLVSEFAHSDREAF